MILQRTGIDNIILMRLHKTSLGRLDYKYLDKESIHFLLVSIKPL